jgi:hypothetical protein
MAPLARIRGSRVAKADTRVAELAGRIEREELAVLEAGRNAEQAAALLDDLALLEARGEQTAEVAEQKRAALSQRVFDAGQQTDHRRRVLEALRRDHADAKHAAGKAQFEAAVEERDRVARETVDVATRYASSAATTNEAAVALEEARARVKALDDQARALPHDTDVPGLPVDECDFPDVAAITRVAESGPLQPISKASRYAAETEAARRNSREASITRAVRDLLATPAGTDARDEFRAGILANVAAEDRAEVERCYEVELAQLRERHGAEAGSGRRPARVVLGKG